MSPVASHCPGGSSSSSACVLAKLNFSLFFTILHLCSCFSVCLQITFSNFMCQCSCGPPLILLLKRNILKFKFHIEKKFFEWNVFMWFKDPNNINKYSWRMTYNENCTYSCSLYSTSCPSSFSGNH